MRLHIINWSRRRPLVLIGPGLLAFIIGLLLSGELADSMSNTIYSYSNSYDTSSYPHDNNYFISDSHGFYQNRQDSPEDPYLTNFNVDQVTSTPGLIPDNQSGAGFLSWLSSMGDDLWKFLFGSPDEVNQDFEPLNEVWSNSLSDPGVNPPYYNDYLTPHGDVAYQQNNKQEHPQAKDYSVSYDPGTKTLYIDKNAAELLKLKDGETVPLPDTVLREAIRQGQVSILFADKKGANAVQEGFQASSPVTLEDWSPVANGPSYYYK